MGAAKPRWPVTPRHGQAEVAGQLARFIEDEKRIIFSAPTGWGKTHCVIAALLTAKAIPAVWMVRSLVLGNRIADDAALWQLHTFVAAGRERTCPLAERLGSAVHEFCRYFRYKCPYARLPPTPPLAISWEELATKGKEEGWCPYYAQDVVESDLIVQNYFKRARPARAFVVDEAHNLLVPDEREVKLSQLAEAVAAARERGASDAALRALQSLLRYALIKDGDLSVTLFLREEVLDEIRRLHYEALEEGDRRLKVLVDITRAAAAYVEGERIHLYRPPLAIPFRPALFISATLPPESASLLGAEVEVRIPWTVKPKAKVVTDVTTKFEEYDSGMAIKYKKLLIEAAKQYRRVLVFAASERVARDLRAWATYEEATPPEGWEGILLLRARGRFSEGIDAPADCVIVAGSPYLPPEVSSRLARLYKRAGHPDPVKAAIDTPMLISTLQCIGRAWRTPDKPPSAILADWRYEKCMNVLENYLTFEPGT